jgi:hypothetical protein
MLLFISQFNCLLSGTSLEIAATLDRLTKSNDRLNQQQLEAVLKFCDDQPAEKKTELLTSILKKEQRYDADELKLFVPVLLKVLNEQQNDNFVKIFLFQFFYRQFQMPLDQRFVPENCRMLFSIIDSFVSSEAVRQRFLRSDYLTQLQKQNKPDDVFLYLSLCFCLYGKDTTELFDRFSLCPKLEHRTDRKLFEAMFSSVVSKAVNSKTHQVIIEWGMRAAGAEYLNDSKAKFDVRELYIKELRKYGTQNWKDGKNAQPQAAAFIVYLFETQKERRSQWGFGGNIQKIFGGSDYIKNSSQKKTVYETVQRQIGKTYDGAVLEHFRTLIVGYRTRWEKTKYRIESCWNAMDEFIQDHWIKILVVVCIIAISVTCWLYRSDIETHLHSWISSNSSPGTDQNGNSEGQGTKEPQPQEQPKK